MTWEQFACALIVVGAIGLLVEATMILRQVRREERERGGA